MAKHWALIIGINHYQSFQSLQYARQDAEAIQQFLQQYQSVSPQHCLLLTDGVSPYVNPEGKSWPMVPQGSIILERLEWLCAQALAPKDLLWVFFSGYGVCHGGEDYLMPWDGEPERVAETGVQVRSLLHLLHSAATNQILLLLDINRSQGVLSSQLPGQKTAELADQLGISTILSCQPHQFSHETAELGQGLFTVALLEGLRLHQFQTLSQLTPYLGDRLPQLCDHHWRPLQIPMVIGPGNLGLYPASTQSIVMTKTGATLDTATPDSPQVLQSPQSPQSPPPQATSPFRSDDS
jgi:uncharacterized caspase-like protein